MSVFVFISAGSPGAEDVKSTSYSVIMVGNSNVGKTSFMRRVLSGTFSSDLPSSVGKTLFFLSNLADKSCWGTSKRTVFRFAGLDMCLWPVTVDGKRVVLQLWDTAGQERRVSWVLWHYWEATKVAVSLFWCVGGEFWDATEKEMWLDQSHVINTYQRAVRDK